jgi:DNA polymerase-3 subunit gamma/tau
VAAWEGETGTFMGGDYPSGLASRGRAARRMPPMSYVVLARKYRPRSFEEMVGQDHVVRALTHALEQQRLHHAYLFTGTRGIGKTTVSRILAKSLNCTGPDGTGGITARPCGVCSACREIDADRYIDYVELDAASNRSIDEIRELIERAAYKPTVGRFKVFMIDEAHQLTKDAFNALLKTLEEPPEYLKFVLATTDPEKMLPTVLSRCLQFNLRPMAPQTVAEHLAHVLSTEAVAVEPGALRLLSRAARGSMRDALSLTDQAIAYGGGQLQEAAVRAMLGTVDRRHAERLVAALAQRDGRAVLEQADGLRSQGLSAAGTLEEMARLLQQMAVEQAVPGALDDTDPDTEAARQLAASLAADETQLLYSIVLHGRAELNLAPDEYAGLVMVLLRFMAFPPEGGSSGGGGAGGGSGGSGVGVGAGGDAGSVQRPRQGTAAGSGPRASAPLVASAPVATSVVRAPVTPSSSVAAPKVVMAEVVEPQRPASAVSASESASPAPVKPAPATATVAKVVANAKPSAQVVDDGPPAWMDEAPFEDEYSAAVVKPAPLQAMEPSQQAQAHRPTLVAEVPPAAAEASRSVVRVLADADIVVPSTVTPLSAVDAVRVTRTALGDQWSQAVAGMQAAGGLIALVRELALQAELVRQDRDGDIEVWHLVVQRDTLRAAPLVDKLQAALQTWAGKAIRLQAQSGVAQDSPARRDAEFAAVRQAKAEEAVHAHPMVRAVLAQFATARIVAGSIRPL